MLFKMGQGHDLVFDLCAFATILAIFEVFQCIVNLVLYNNLSHKIIDYKFSFVSQTSFAKFVGNKVASHESS